VVLYERLPSKRNIMASSMRCLCSLDSKPMNFDLFLLRDLLLNKKLGNVLSLVTLQLPIHGISATTNSQSTPHLNDFAQFGIIDNRAITRECLLHRTQHLLKVDFLIDSTSRQVSLQHIQKYFPTLPRCRKSFSTSTLLDANVHKIRRLGSTHSVVEIIFSKRI
jgi:hypothetical protein